ncbi:UDP-glycosyltransferase UGT5-like isoform X1 [Daktulosphaira vitifoliae]|uniref:UDP-glycosyltransferase UGT5-like isoform X1 n=1 Tax=Daktulosphaira vitifoliae TaxID=58002 RepID=UPI0021AA827F|nr:UDP-glycosyltransferase UGT5-like isoform X1 [Daktulosphaira vitifoliae]
MNVVDFYIKVINMVFLSVIYLFILFSSAYTANILCVFPHRGLSHHMMYLPYIQKLKDEGHNLTTISHYSFDHPNITEISIKGSIELINNKLPFSNRTLNTVEKIVYLLWQFHATGKVDEVMFKVEDVKRMLAENSTNYDLLITEHFKNELPLIFAHKFKIPTILLSSSGLLPWSQFVVAQSYEMSTIPAVLGGFSKKMNFYERFINTLIISSQMSSYKLLFRSSDNEIIKKNLNIDVSLGNVAQNTSLILVNTHHFIHGTKPLVPAIIEVGGIHIKPSKQLPVDIRKFIDEAEHGIIYFCMGSLLRGETFPAHKRQMFLNVFSKLKQKVLWKWEGDMPGITSNVMIKKWMPQRDILAHPNVKLFISHGGLLGTTEAVYEGVPILAMPIFGDQMTNIKAVMDTGGAEMLNYNNLEEDEIFNKIKAMLTNPIYKNKANKLSEIFRDRPMSPLESAVYWTEYVIKHKGAPHLRTAAVGMPWFQYYLIDVFLVIIIIIVTLCFVIYFTLSKLQNLLKSSIK